MTKKDYIIIAKAIHAEYAYNIDYYSHAENNLALTRLVERLAENFIKDNPRFDKTKFLIMCGYNS